VSAALLALGCASTPPPAPPPELALRLPPSALGMELSLAQRITVVRAGGRQGFDALLEADAREVRVAAVALGRRVASLRWDGATLDADVAAQVPAVITAQRILTDVQLAWWPVEAVLAGLPPGFALDADAATRTVRRGGEVVVTLRYEGQPPAWRRVTLDHRERGYMLEIDSVEQP
jgi:hypothetical protein